MYYMGDLMTARQFGPFAPKPEDEPRKYGFREPNPIYNRRSMGSVMMPERKRVGWEDERPAFGMPRTASQYMPLNQFDRRGSIDPYAMPMNRPMPTGRQSMMRR